MDKGSIKIILLTLCLVFLVIMALGRKAFSQDSGDVFLNISIGGKDNNGFESPDVDWTFDTYDKAVMRVAVTNSPVHGGSQSLKLDCHLICTSPSNSGAAKWVMASPTNMFNKTISAYVWCPRGSGGPSYAPNGLTLYVKVGTDWRWKDGGWNNIGNLTNQWVHLTWTLNSGWAQTNVMEVGLKYGASGTCSAANNYTGPIFLDDYTW